MNLISSITNRLFVAAILFFGSCAGSPELNTLSSFKEFIYQPENGFTKEKKINGLVLSATFLPPEYLALKELKGRQAVTQAAFDSLRQAYSSSLSFIVKVKREGAGSKDEVEKHHGVSAPLVTEQMLKESFYLEGGAHKSRAKLCLVEDFKGLAEEPLYYLVFTKDTEFEQSSSLKLVFTDHIFQTGISYFSFRQEDIQYPSTQTIKPSL